jgi:lactoylglutathione lyase
MNNEEKTEEFDPRMWVWGTDATKPRVLHTMVRVKDFEKALKFYLDGLGMRVLMNRFDVESRRVSAMFIGFNDYFDGGALELTDQWDHAGPYQHGSSYGHVSIGVPDIEGMLARLEGMGAEVTQRPTVLKPGGPKVAFVKDFDGFDVELIQTARG